MNKEQLRNSLFEIADLWTYGISAAKYIDFLYKLYQRITVVAGSAEEERRMTAAVAVRTDHVHRPLDLLTALVVNASDTESDSDQPLWIVTSSEEEEDDLDFEGEGGISKKLGMGGDMEGLPGANSFGARMAMSFQLSRDGNLDVYNDWFQSGPSKSAFLLKPADLMFTPQTIQTPTPQNPALSFASRPLKSDMYSFSI